MHYVVLLFVVLCSFSFTSAQMLPGARPIAVPMADSAGKPLLMDFNIKLSGIKDTNMPFSVFNSRPLMVYYFSPFCPHCQKGYGGIQQIAKEYEQKGLASIAVSVNNNVGKRDILKFMEEQRASIPFFQDVGDFGKKYGDGYIPRLYLVSSDGKVTRYTAFEGENLKDIRSDIEKLLSK